jgi:hypothetical protein
MYMENQKGYLDQKMLTKKLVLSNEKKKVFKKGQMFLKGPIPYPFLTKVANLPGKALHVAIAVLFLSGLTKSKTVTLKNSLLRELGVSRYSGYRALKKIEQVGLVSVLRKHGRNPIVTLLK